MTKFKRLIKKSWDTITLYHGTTSETLMGVMESGYIYPGGYIDKVSNGLFDQYDEYGDPLPSLAQDGVYLCSTEERAEYYANEAMSRADEFFLPVVLGVIFKVKVQTDALLPDYDDLVGKFSPEWIQRAKEKLKERGKNPEEYWRQSIYAIEQVVHVGPISISEIEGVMFVHYMIKRGITYEEAEKMLEESGIQFSTWMSFSEATSKFKEFLKKVNQY